MGESERVTSTVNLPLVVSNCALKVSGAFSVSLAGSVNPGEAGRGFASLLVSCPWLYERDGKKAERTN